MKTVFILVVLWSSAYKGGQIIIPDFNSKTECVTQGKLLLESSSKYDTFHCVEQTK